MTFHPKRTDLIVGGCILLLVMLFIFFPRIVETYRDINTRHGLLASFFKFAVLATAGESLALRITSGRYHHPGFGLLPRAIVWGLLGIPIKLSFVLFAAGVPAIWSFFNIATDNMFSPTGLTGARIVGAFSISLTMNMIFAPLLFVLHAITNEHIHRSGGKLKRFFTPIAVSDIIVNLNWSVIWNFAIKKCIPFFWIPAHTITFLLPVEHQILAAALLGIVLGVILALTNMAGDGAH